MILRVLTDPEVAHPKNHPSTQALQREAPSPDMHRDFAALNFTSGPSFLGYLCSSITPPPALRLPYLPLGGLDLRHGIARIHDA